MKKSSSAKKLDPLDGIYILNGHYGQPCKDLIVEILKDEGRYCIVTATDERVTGWSEVLVDRENLKPVLPEAVKDSGPKKSKSSSKDQMVTLRMSPEEVTLIDKIAKDASESVGIEVTRSWVFRELLKIGAETLQKRFRG